KYLEEAEKEWDGEQRVALLLPEFLGVEISEVTTLQTKIFFVGAVAKVFNPNSKFDYVLDLVGGQGVGKTTFLKKISNGWYTDQFTDFKDKDSYMNMQRALIVNDDEMTATNNSDFETLKKFISSEELEYRPPYGRSAVRRPKNFVIARTTNESTYLKDKTGERRFMPNMANKRRQIKSPITDLTPEIIKQFWGECVHYYNEGFNFMLSDEENELLEENRKSFMYIDETETQIEEVLAGWPGTFITSSQIAKELGEENLIRNRKLAKKIKYIMDNHKEWEPAHKKINGISKRGYKKV
ncbi:helicase, partial [Lactobacillus salivarius]